MNELGQRRVDLAPHVAPWAIGGLVLLLACIGGAGAAVLLEEPLGAAPLLVFALVIPLPMVVNGLRNWSTELEVYDRGFRLRYGGREHRALWSDVRGVRHDTREIGHAGDPQARFDDGEIQLRDGSKLRFRGLLGVCDLRGVFQGCALISDPERLRKELFRAKMETFR